MFDLERAFLKITDYHWVLSQHRGHCLTHEVRAMVCKETKWGDPPCIYDHAHDGCAEGCQQCQPNEGKAIVPIPISSLQQHRPIQNWTLHTPVHTLVMLTQHGSNSML